MRNVGFPCIAVFDVCPTVGAMDMPDLVVEGALRWGFDKVEARFGRAAAWLVTIALVASLIGMAVAVWKTAI